MFVRLRDFKRLIKEAYTGAGLYVARRGDQLLFSGSYWAIATIKESLDKKALAAVIEIEEEELTVTRLVLNKHPYGQAMRILQAEDGQVDVLGEGFIQAIDPASMNTDYEYKIEGPFINRHFPKQVYWKSGRIRRSKDKEKRPWRINWIKTQKRLSGRS